MKLLDLRVLWDAQAALAQYLRGQKENFTISREKGDHYHIQHCTTIFFFSHYNLFLGNLKEKFARKAGVNTGRVYRIVLMCPGHPIILLKSNKFNIADVWTKRPIKSKYLRTQNSVLVFKRPSFSFPFKSFLLVVIK